MLLASGHTNSTTAALLSIGIGLVAAGVFVLVSAFVRGGRLANYPTWRAPLKLVGGLVVAAGAVLFIIGVAMN